MKKQNLETFDNKNRSFHKENPPSNDKKIKTKKLRNKIKNQKLMNGLPKYNYRSPKGVPYCVTK